MENPTETDIRSSFLTALIARSEGQQHMLSISVDAEEGDEGGIFDQLAEVVAEPKLRRIVERHRDDEARHAQLFRDCLTRLGFEQQTIPDDMKIIHHIASKTGGFDKGVHTTEDVVNTYALLLAIEERGVEQFPLLAEAFRPFDPETAEVYLRVARDERGHVRYCEQIGRHYAADEAAWQHALAEARALESGAFAEVGLANLLYAGERGWVDVDAVLGSAA